MRKNTVSRIATVTIVALALAFVWGTAVAWLGSFVLPGNATQHEDIMVAVDGTPVISSRSYYDYREQEYRTLDGKVLSGSLVNALGPAYLTAISKPPGLWREPITWPQRIAGIASSSRPLTRWYYLRNPNVAGQAYFAVYDAASKLPIGYLGRSGLRPTVPPNSDWFDADAGVSYDLTEGALATSGWFQPRSYPFDYSYATDTQSDVPTWLLFVKDGDAVREVDMRKQTIRLIQRVPDLIALTTLTEPDSPVERISDSDAKTDDTESLQKYNDAKTRMRIALRTKDQIRVLNPRDDSHRDYILPPWAREAGLSVYSIGGDQLLLQFDAGSWRGGRTVELVWIDSLGKELQKERVQLAGYAPQNPRTIAWGASAVAPIPLGWLIGVGGIGPAQYVQSNQAPNLAVALRRVVNEVWPPMVLVFLLGATCASITWSLHNRYFRPQPWPWVMLSFFLGPASLFAYWLHWRRPPRQRCESCGVVVPRDREACAACGAEFSTPALVGTEVFA
ncbi:MAG: hypothetical protein WD851_18880 [Pirellulales bacterium]